MLQLLQRGDRSAQEPATRMGMFYSFHACSENISFGSLDEITLVVGVLVAQLVWRHSCVADRLLVVVRFPAGPRVSLKTVDPLKGNGPGKKTR